MIRAGYIIVGLAALASSGCSTDQIVEARRPAPFVAPIVLPAEMLAEVMLPGYGLSCNFENIRGDTLPVSVSLNQKKLRRLHGQLVETVSQFFETPNEYDVRWSLPDPTGELAYHYRLLVEKNGQAATLDTVFLMENPEGRRTAEEERLVGTCQRGRIE
jgi:hypothetical protein